jgi:hypothetical protein
MLYQWEIGRLSVPEVADSSGGSATPTELPGACASAPWLGRRQRRGAARD